MRRGKQFRERSKEITMYEGQLEGGMQVYGEHEDVAGNNISVRLVF